MRQLLIAVVAAGLLAFTTAGTGAVAASTTGNPTTPAANQSVQATAAPTAGGDLPSTPVIGIKLVDAPVSEKNDPRAHSYIIDHLAPGAVISRRIEVVNTTAATAAVSLYATAATIAGGSFTGGLQGDVDELTRWTSVSRPLISLPPRTSAEPAVRIAVPRDAAPGERYGVVWAQVASRNLAGVEQVSRVGIRIYLSIGPGNPPATDFAVEQLVAGRGSDGRPTLAATVRNTGGRAIDLSGTVNLTNGPGGLSGGPFKVVLGSTLAPGQTEPVGIALDPRLPNGPWDARITLTSGEVSRDAMATIVFPSGGTAPPVVATGVPAIPAAGTSWWVITGIAVVVLIMVVAVFLVARARRSTRGSRRSSPVPVGRSRP